MSCGMTDLGGLEPHVQAGNAVAREFNGEFVQSLKCKKCGYVRFPTPASEVLDQYYQTTYPKHAASWYNIEADFAEWKRVPRADRIVELAERFDFHPGVFHEVGCAFGGTVFELAVRGYVATGSDLNKAAIEQGRERGSEIFSSDQQRILELTYSPTVLYGFHQLEHVPEPVEYIKGLTEILDTQDAIMAFFVPNVLAAFPLVHGYSRYSWYAYPDHLHLFSPRSLLCLAEAANLTLIHVSSTPYSVHPEATSRILQPVAGSEVARELCDYAIGEAMIFPELEFVLARPDSAVASRFAAYAQATKQRCLRAETFEKSITTLIKRAPLTAP